MLGGMKLIYSENALAVTSVRTFPFSKHRSKRIHKKLVKRYGGEFVMEPAMYHLGQDTIMIHPMFKSQVEHHFKPDPRKYVLGNNYWP